jgi:ABC-type transporter lipoprotein component MlaA
MYEKVNYTSMHIGEYESFTKDSISLYQLLKDAYEQRRKQQIKE